MRRPDTLFERLELSGALLAAPRHDVCPRTGAAQVQYVLQVNGHGPLIRAAQSYGRGHASQALAELHARRLRRGDVVTVSGTEWTIAPDGITITRVSEVITSGPGMPQRVSVTGRLVRSVGIIISEGSGTTRARYQLRVAACGVDVVAVQQIGNCAAARSIGRTKRAAMRLGDQIIAMARRLDVIGDALTLPDTLHVIAGIAPARHEPAEVEA